MVASPCRDSIRIAGSHPAAAEDAPSISTMLKEGWQIAGYGQASDNRSTLILFRHPDQALSGSVPGRLRRDAHATHLLDLLQAQVSPFGFTLGKSGHRVPRCRAAGTLLNMRD